MVTHGLGRLLCVSGSLPYMDKTHIAARSLNPFFAIYSCPGLEAGGGPQ